MAGSLLEIDLLIFNVTVVWMKNIFVKMFSYKSSSNIHIDKSSYHSSATNRKAHHSTTVKSKSKYCERMCVSLIIFLNVTVVLRQEVVKFRDRDKCAFHPSHVASLLLLRPGYI